MFHKKVSVIKYILYQTSPFSYWNTLHSFVVSVAKKAPTLAGESVYCDICFIQPSQPASQSTISRSSEKSAYLHVKWIIIDTWLHQSRFNNAWHEGQTLLHKAPCVSIVTRTYLSVAMSGSTGRGFFSAGPEQDPVGPSFRRAAESRWPLRPSERPSMVAMRAAQVVEHILGKVLRKKTNDRLSYPSQTTDNNGVLWNRDQTKKDIYYQIEPVPAWVKNPRKGHINCCHLSLVWRIRVSWKMVFLVLTEFFPFHPLLEILYDTLCTMSQFREIENWIFKALNSLV